MSTKPDVRIALARPTVTIAVFRSQPLADIRNLGSPSTRKLALQPELYVVRFQSKFDGGLALPGEGWDHFGENPEDGAIRAAKEELGLIITREQLFPFTTRALRGRDLREKAFLYHKMTHDRPVPVELGDVNPALFQPDHCSDMVFVVAGVDMDPATMEPVDKEEVARIETLKLDEELPPLPISDDTQLVTTLAKWRSGELEHSPPFLHFQV